MQTNNEVINYTIAIQGVKNHNMYTANALQEVALSM